MEGYGIQTADEFINPVKWSVFVGKGEDEDRLVSTVDDFYTGNDKDGIYVGGVKDIFDTTITELILNPNRTFAFAEMKYFKRWYDDQESALKDKVKELVLNGQLDLVGGGWSSPDEATTTYD